MCALRVYFAPPPLVCVSLPVSVVACLRSACRILVVGPCGRRLVSQNTFQTLYIRPVKGRLLLQRLATLTIPHPTQRGCQQRAKMPREQISDMILAHARPPAVRGAHVEGPELHRAASRPVLLGELRG